MTLLSKTTKLAVVLLFSPFFTFTASAQTQPTWTVKCSTDANQPASASIEIDATRTSSISQAVAVVNYLYITNPQGVGHVYHKPSNMSGNIEDGRSHLVLHLKPNNKNQASAIIKSLDLDLSYENSVSVLTLTDGSTYHLQCN